MDLMEVLFLRSWGANILKVEGRMAVMDWPEVVFRSRISSMLALSI